MQELLISERKHTLLVVANEDDLAQGRRVLVHERYVVAELNLTSFVDQHLAEEGSISRPQSMMIEKTRRGDRNKSNKASSLKARVGQHAQGA